MLNKTCVSALGAILCFMLLAQVPVIAGANLIASATVNLKVWGNAYYNGYSYVFYQQDTAAFYKYSSNGGVTWSDAYSLGFSADFTVAQDNERIVITWWADTTHMYLINGTIGNGEITLSLPIYITHPRAITKLSKHIAFHPTDDNIIYMTHTYKGSSTYFLFTKVNISVGVEAELIYQSLWTTEYYYTLILGNYCVIYWAWSGGATIYIKTYNIQTGATTDTSVAIPVDLDGGTEYGGGSIKIGNDMYVAVVGNGGNKVVLLKFTLTDNGVSSACAGVVDDTITTFTNFNFAQMGSVAIGVGGTSSNEVYRFDFNFNTRTFVNKTQVTVNVVDNPIKGYAIVLNSTNFGVVYTKLENTYYNLYVDTHGAPIELTSTYLIGSSPNNLKIWGTAYYNGYTYVFYLNYTTATYIFSSDGGVTWSNPYLLGFSAEFAVNQDGDRILITWGNSTHMYYRNATIGNGPITLSPVKYVAHPREISAVSRTIAFHPTDENIFYMAHGYSNALSFTMVNLSANTETELMYALDAGYYYFVTILGDYCVIYWAQPDGTTIYVRTYNIQTGAWDETSFSSPVNLGRGSYYGGSGFKLNDEVYGTLVGYSPNKVVLLKFTPTGTGINALLAGVVDDTLYASFKFAQIGSSVIGVGGTSNAEVYMYNFNPVTKTFVNKTQVTTNIYQNPVRAYAVVLNSTNFGSVYTKFEDPYYNLYVNTHKVQSYQTGGTQTPTSFTSMNITINTWSSFASTSVTINTWSSFTGITLLITTHFNAFSAIAMTITTNIAPFGMITAYIVTNETQPPETPGPGEQPGGGGGKIELPYEFSANYIALALLLLIPTVVIKQQVGSFATIPTLTVMWLISFFAQLISLGLFVIGLVILIAFMFRRRMQGGGV